MKNRLLKTKEKTLKNQKGMATIETIPLLVIFVLLMAYALGMWGSIHTGILYSIASRTYALETFRHRTDLTYFRENKSGLTTPMHMDEHQMRFHGIAAPNATIDQDWTATERSITRGMASKEVQAKQVDHNQNIFNLETRNAEGGVEVNPIWVMVGYGICLNTACGDR